MNQSSNILETETVSKILNLCSEFKWLIFPELIASKHIFKKFGCTHNIISVCINFMKQKPNYHQIFKTKITEQ